MIAHSHVLNTSHQNDESNVSGATLLGGCKTKTAGAERENKLVLVKDWHLGQPVEAFRNTTKQLLRKKARKSRCLWRESPTRDQEMPKGWLFDLTANKTAADSPVDNTRTQHKLWERPLCFLPSCRRACKQAKKLIDTKGAHHGLNAKPTFPNKRYLFSNTAAAAAAFVDVECPDDSINTRRSSRWGSQGRTGGGAKSLVSLPRRQCLMTAFPLVIQLHWHLNGSRRGCFSSSGERTVALAESQQPDMRKAKKKSHIFTWRNPGLGGAWWCLHVRAEYETYHHLPWNETLHTITSSK